MPPPMENGLFGKKFSESVGGVAPEMAAGPKVNCVPPAPSEVIVTFENSGMLVKLSESAKAAVDIRATVNRTNIATLLNFFIVFPLLECLYFPAFRAAIRGSRKQSFRSCTLTIASQLPKELRDCAKCLRPR